MKYQVLSLRRENWGEEYPSWSDNAVKLFKADEFIIEGEGIRNLQLAMWRGAVLHLQPGDKLCLFESVAYDGSGPRDALWIPLVISCLMAVLIPSVVLVLFLRNLWAPLLCSSFVFSSMMNFCSSGSSTVSLNKLLNL